MTQTEIIDDLNRRLTRQTELLQMRDKVIKIYEDEVIMYKDLVQLYKERIELVKKLSVDYDYK